MPFWWPQRPQPPELVADQEVEIGPDGTVKVEIDTARAKAIHPDEDHSYTITAEVVDQSRRTIVGTGTVLVARQPFKVYAWVDRGYYRVGDAGFVPLTQFVLVMSQLLITPSPRQVRFCDVPVAVSAHHKGGVGHRRAVAGVDEKLNRRGRKNFPPR